MKNRARFKSDFDGLDDNTKDTRDLVEPVNRSDSSSDNNE